MFSIVSRVRLLLWLLFLFFPVCGVFAKNPVTSSIFLPITVSNGNGDEVKITGLRMEDYPKPGTPGSCKMVIDFSLTAKSAGTVGVYFKPFFKGKHSPEYNANSGSPEFSGTTAGIHELYFSTPPKGDHLEVIMQKLTIWALLKKRLFDSELNLINEMVPIEFRMIPENRIAGSPASPSPEITTPEK